MKTYAVRHVHSNLGYVNLALIPNVGKLRVYDTNKFPRLLTEVNIIPEAAIAEQEKDIFYSLKDLMFLR